MYMYVLTQYNQWKRIPTIYRVCTCMYSPNTTNGKEFLLYIVLYIHLCTLFLSLQELFRHTIIAISFHCKLLMLN